jgi:AcrR family transcriptional regulator
MYPSSFMCYRHLQRSPKAPMYAKSSQTIARILEAAQELFTTNNYADVSMSEIAETAEVTKGAIYHHFSGKEDLYLTMMHNYLDDIQSMTSEIVEEYREHSCREQVRVITFSFLGLPATQQDLMRLVRRDINSFKDPEREKLIKAYQKALPKQVETIIRRGISSGELLDGDARLLSWEHVAIVEVVLRPYARKVLGDIDTMADYVNTLFFDGVARRQAAAGTGDPE